MRGIEWYNKVTKYFIYTVAGMLLYVVSLYINAHYTTGLHVSNSDLYYIYPAMLPLFTTSFIFFGKFSLTLFISVILSNNSF